MFMKTWKLSAEKGYAVVTNDVSLVNVNEIVQIYTVKVSEFYYFFAELKSGQEQALAVTPYTREEEAKFNITIALKAAHVSLKGF